MTLYYTDHGDTVTEWYYDSFGHRHEFEHVKGPNWARWVRGDCPLTITTKRGWFVVEEMKEVAQCPDSA
jgi:hypothetical protein